MARHLFIGDESAVSYTSGILDFGSIDIQKKHGGGATAAIMSLVVGETVADSDMIRIVQGDSSGTGRNIVSPWFYGRDVINWSGKSYSAAVSQSSTIQVTGAATNTADVEVTIKLVNTSNGQSDPFDAKSYTVITNANSINTAAEIGDNFTGAMYSGYSISGSASLSATQSDELPWFVKSVTWDGTNTITLVGWDKGETMQNGQVAEYHTTFDIVIENGDAVANGGTYTISAPNQSAQGTLGDAGYGDGEYVYQMESDLMGINSGYYNRVQLPVTPTSNAVKATNYDIWNVVATKDGSSHSQIHGVDNLIDISVAITTGSGANALSFENRMNAYLGSVGFAPVIL
tara:strand:- start:2137 stop:3171 length:1035 start_codon:yes stop_codon:yes gene_type:complete